MNLSVLRNPLLLALLVLICSSQLFGQNYLVADSIPFFNDTTELRSKYAGGLNMPQLSSIELDGNNMADLFVFDREGNKILCFLNKGSAGIPIYKYAPEYEAAFPDLSDWALMRDYNCDGLADIFTSFDNGIRVYENTSVGGVLSFQLAYSKLKTDDGGTDKDIYVPWNDIPVFDDLDSDGDLDVLAFDLAGSYTVWFKNLAIETGNCDTLSLVVQDACWGKFFESGLSNQVTLGGSCKGNVYTSTVPQNGLHAGSTLCTFDSDSDGDKDLLLGDLLSNQTVYLRNGGSSTNALMDTAEYNFPGYDFPATFEMFPATYYVQIDNSGRPDLLAAPNALNNGLNYESLWYYKDIGIGNDVVFSLANQAFLQDQMIEVGKGARPTFLDVNGDGLLDLVMGNESYKTKTEHYSGLTVYTNSGTSIKPQFNLLSRDFQDLSTDFIPGIFAMMPTYGDLDNDGDQDMICGDHNGRVHYYENTGGAGNPVNFASPIFNYMSIDIGSFSAPFLIDINRNGKLDLVIGEMGGNLNLYLNTGSKMVPVFGSSPDNAMLGGIDVMLPCCTGFSVPFFYDDPASGGYQLLLGWEEGTVQHFNNIDGNLGGNWTQVDSMYKGIDAGLNSVICGADITGDGHMELAVGNLRGGITLYRPDIVNGIVTDRSPSLDFMLYPNPSKNTGLNIYAKGIKGEVAVKILDLNGREVFVVKAQFISNELQLKTADIKPGLYFVRLETEDGKSAVKKWIVLD